MEDSVYLEMASVEARHWWFTGRRRILDAEISRRLPPAPPGGRRVLEVGSGTGGNLELLKTFGAEAGYLVPRIKEVLGKEADPIVKQIEASKTPRKMLTVEEAKTGVQQ